MSSTAVEESLRTTAFDLGHRRSASEIVADSIRSMIAVGGIQPGERLPSERDLAALLGAARVTVRQAVKQLSMEGLVATTLGRSGGTTVLEQWPGRSPRPPMPCAQTGVGAASQKTPTRRTVAAALVMGPLRAGPALDRPPPTRLRTPLGGRR